MCIRDSRVTSEICIAGRNIVLIPFSDKISISQKIKSSEERSRLKKIVSGIKPNNFGVIIRTIAENKTVQEIETDLKDSKGKEYKDDILFGKHRDVYIALICQHYGIYKTEEKNNSIDKVKPGDDKYDKGQRTGIENL